MKVNNLLIAYEQNISDFTHDGLLYYTYNLNIDNYVQTSSL